MPHLVPAPERAEHEPAGGRYGRARARVIDMRGDWGLGTRLRRNSREVHELLRMRRYKC